jgi:hypothetical protein
MSSMSGATGYQGVQSPNATGNKIPKGYRLGQINQYTPGQEQLFQQGMQNVGPESYLSRLAGGDQSQFAQMEAPALRQFNELQGGIASRFSGGGGGAGSMSSRRSSGFQNAQTAAAQDFASQLQSKRMDLRNQAIRDLHGMSQDLLGQRPYEQKIFEKPQGQQGGGWGGAASGALGGAASGSAFGPWGTAAGALIGGTAGYFS